MYEMMQKNYNSPRVSTGAAGIMGQWIHLNSRRNTKHTSARNQNSVPHRLTLQREVRPLSATWLCVRGADGSVGVQSAQNERLPNT